MSLASCQKSKYQHSQCFLPWTHNFSVSMTCWREGGVCSLGSLWLCKLTRKACAMVTNEPWTTLIPSARSSWQIIHKHHHMAEQALGQGLKALLKEPQPPATGVRMWARMGCRSIVLISSALYIASSAKVGLPGTQQKTEKRTYPSLFDFSGVSSPCKSKVASSMKSSLIDPLWIISPRTL